MSRFVAIGKIGVVIRVAQNGVASVRSCEL